MTKERFTTQRVYKGFDGEKIYEWCVMDYGNILLRLTTRMDCKDVCEVLNSFHEENEQLKQGISKLQSKYDKSKTDEVNILVETENMVLLEKKEFEEYVRRHNELRRRNKRRKEKNRKYRNELKKRLREISGLKEFIAEDLSSDDKVLKGFIEEYL